MKGLKNTVYIIESGEGRTVDQIKQESGEGRIAEQRKQESEEGRIAEYSKQKNEKALQKRARRTFGREGLQNRESRKARSEGMQNIASRKMRRHCRKEQVEHLGGKDCRIQQAGSYTVKKGSRVSRLQPGWMSLTKLPLGRNNSVMTSLFPPRESLVVTSRLGTRNSRTFFYGVANRSSRKIGRDCRKEQVRSKLGRDLLLNIENRKLGSKGLQNRASRGARVRNDIGSAP